ncbi:MAG: YlxR family protein [Micrococcales bacterium]|nr:YlxR family protein [Micrococcales bacterium]
MADQVWRMCVGCRARDSIAALVRVVKSPTSANALVVDYARRLPGRGAWVHPRAKCLQQAVSQQTFGRALRLSGVLDAEALIGLTERSVAKHKQK